MLTCFIDNFFIEFIRKVVSFFNKIMHETIKNLINIENQIKSSLNSFNNRVKPKIIAVSKTFGINDIVPLIKYGHIHYGENKVQEAMEKWTAIKEENPEIKLHMIGKLQTNKVRFAAKLFDYIHSVDNEKILKKISNEGDKLKKKIKIFIQVNIGDENQKSGIDKNNLDELIYCAREENVELLGLMCIPPNSIDPLNYFKEMEKLNNTYDFPELSMGMSSDYLQAIENSATFVRIGSSIFGNRF